ncbi:5-oxoprolinase subunit PxpA [Aliidiomarina sp. Khilg15.8]
MRGLKLNCDLGEGFGPYNMGQDDLIMPLIDQANIACGMHASDPLTLVRTVRMAAEHGVEIGAHPGYPDKEGFGRRAMALSSAETEALVLYQLAALDGVARSFDTEVGYVKPHGALYHAMMADEITRHAIFAAAARYWSRPAVVMLATSRNQDFQREADHFGLTLRFEAFADRAYDDQGMLVARTEADAVHHEQSRVVAQAEDIAIRAQVRTRSGTMIDLPADTLCVHGDNMAALEAVKAIRTMLQSQ